MKFFKMLVKISVAFAKWSAIITAMLMTVMIFLQVIFRYVIGSSLSFSEELARYAFIWSVAMGSAIALKTRSHMGVELLVDNLPASIRKYALVFASFLNLVFFAILIVYGFSMTTKTMGQSSAALSLPMGYVYISIPLSAIVLFMCEVNNTIEDFFSIRKKDEAVKGE
jgi:TRAP-type transport system small permease protein